MTGWPICSESAWPMMRVVGSAEPPGGKPTTRRMGLFGYCASALPSEAASAIPSRILFMVFSSAVFITEKYNSPHDPNRAILGRRHRAGARRLHPHPGQIAAFRQGLGEERPYRGGGEAGRRLVQEARAGGHEARGGALARADAGAVPGNPGCFARHAADVRPPR